jgi:heterotetrameric sarcosine oxidase gamma subunit
VPGPEPRLKRSTAPGVRLGTCLTDSVEIAALRGRSAEVQTIAGGRGVRLPALGRASAAADRVAIGVRPDRWLLLTPQSPPGSCAELWNHACAGSGAAIDLSSGLTALRLAGPAVREALARGCRLDLHPDVFQTGHAAATLMAQVAVILVALPSGVLLLTPATTARSLCESLATSAAPFGLERQSALPFSCLCGDPFP